ncbi:MAG: histone deacetylase, partial [Trichodesmium sp. St19_bin2]|nr:histone deacetylase [Trichodesmium sp. St19_bin2]
MNLPVIYHPNYVAPIPPGHRFPMAKFQLLYEMLLVDEVTNHFLTPNFPPLEWIELIHHPNYIKKYC